jgi:hypothetical protein
VVKIENAIMPDRPEERKSTNHQNRQLHCNTRNMTRERIGLNVKLKSKYDLRLYFRRNGKKLEIKLVIIPRRLARRQQIYSNSVHIYTVVRNFINAIV